MSDWRTTGARQRPFRKWGQASADSGRTSLEVGQPSDADDLEAFFAAPVWTLLVGGGFQKSAGSRCRKTAIPGDGDFRPASGLKHRADLGEDFLTFQRRCNDFGEQFDFGYRFQFALPHRLKVGAWQNRCKIVGCQERFSIKRTSPITVGGWHRREMLVSALLWKLAVDSFVCSLVDAAGARVARVALAEGHEVPHELVVVGLTQPEDEAVRRG